METPPIHQVVKRWISTHGVFLSTAPNAMEMDNVSTRQVKEFVLASETTEEVIAINVCLTFTGRIVFRVLIADRMESVEMDLMVMEAVIVSGIMLDLDVISPGL